MIDDIGGERCWSTTASNESGSSSSMHKMKKKKKKLKKKKSFFTLGDVVINYRHSQCNVSQYWTYLHDRLTKMNDAKCKLYTAIVASKLLSITFNHDHHQIKVKFKSNTLIKVAT
ncbi:hypothetical protein BLOT_002543 [Blomia tropicalis]|nr:hypothetical protein BLOT_002543 [Blomia tropicalis]